MPRFLLLLLLIISAGSLVATSGQQGTAPAPGPIVTPTWTQTPTSTPGLLPTQVQPGLDYFINGVKTYGPWVMGFLLLVLLIGGVIFLLSKGYFQGFSETAKKRGEEHAEQVLQAVELPGDTRRYLEKFIEDENQLRFRGLEMRGQVVQPLDVLQIFISICMTPEAERNQPHAKREQIESGEGIAGMKETPEPVDLSQAIRITSKLAIIGAAGCGKSTLLQWAGLTCARAWEANPELKDEQQAFLRAVENHKLIPLLVRLRPFQSYCVEKKRQLSPLSMLDFLTDRLNEKHPSLDLPSNFFKNHLKNTGGLVMLDGVDEVDQEDREAVRQAIEDLVKEYPDPRNRFLVTSRSAAYFGPAEVGGFRKCVVQNLSPEQRNQLIGNWYSAVLPAEQASAQAAQLSQLIDASDTRVRDLAITPLMATIFAHFHYHEGKLPRQRAELYEHAVRILLSERHRDSTAREGWETQRNQLSYIAFQMHEQGSAEWLEDDLVELVAPGFGSPDDLKAACAEARRFIRQAADSGGLLEEQNRRYGFYTHRTFREYLAGRYLAEELGEAEQRGFLLDHIEKDAWEEPILLAAGYLAINGEGRPNRFIRLLSNLDGSKQRHAQSLALAGDALLDLPPSSQQVRLETTRLVTAELLNIITEKDLQIAHPLRSRLGLALGSLGDPRFEVSTIGEGENQVKVIWPKMAPVPAGIFRMGTSKEDDMQLKKQNTESYSDEKPDHPVDMSAFEIGRHPITNAEFALFIEAQGYHRQELWSPDGWRWLAGKRDRPSYWDNPGWNAANLPVVGVSWFEAEAYCNWLSRLCGKRYTLPSEAQWEKAARGKAGNLWPWGDAWDAGKCNSNEGGLGKTSPVGVYPDGESPYGALDMAGNVWEWCLDWYDEEEYKRRKDTTVTDPVGPADGTRRVVRGGSWYFNRDFARCAYRGRVGPDDFYLNLGFRVVLSPN